MSIPRAALNTGVASSRAILPEPPAYWSYSSLREVQECPLRYALERASYPDLWRGKGYPPLPTAAALFGNVVHAALGSVVKALSAAGVASSQAVEATETLRNIGGLTAVVEGATTAQLAPLDDNPRLNDDQRGRITRDLWGRAPEARVQVQTYLSRTAFAPTAAPNVSSHSSGQRNAYRRRELGDGSHAEATLIADDLRLIGRIDLLTIFGTTVRLVDFKTGRELPAHRDQLRLYALLWERDGLANPRHLGIDSLTAAYQGIDVLVEVPSAADLQELAEGVSSQVERADAELQSGSPTPVPSESTCQYCGVRQICEAYWRDVAPKPTDVRDDAWFDYEGLIGDQNGHRSWWVMNPRSNRREYLLRTTAATPPFGQGDWVRILQLRRGTDPEVELPVATMTATSEVFHISA